LKGFIFYLLVRPIRQKVLLIFTEVIETLVKILKLPNLNHLNQTTTQDLVTVILDVSEQEVERPKNKHNLFWKIVSIGEMAQGSMRKECYYTPKASFVDFVSIFGQKLSAIL
jgi:hypothetical protein